MNTPICDFVRSYAEQNALRLHMPGHKGRGVLEVEQWDITEISGADSLYEACGIIRESEQNASELFGSETFYSTEGSSLCIRAMIYLALRHGRQTGKGNYVVAGRNAHKTFMSAAALLNLDIRWLYGQEDDSYLACRIEADDLDRMLSEAEEAPCAVYLTSPDYLGNVADIPAISAVCRRWGVPLLVDCAHGAYLKFLPESRHPIDLGADMCCASAHKTLPVLTGGAYLHIAHDAPCEFARQAKNALALFGSTSPSYLIMQSLDAANQYLADGYPSKLETFTQQVCCVRDKLAKHGFELHGDEPLKLTIATKAYGYKGSEFSDLLMAKGVVSEFADPDFVVFMLTPEIGPEGLEQLVDGLVSIPRRAALTEASPAPQPGQRVFGITEAMLMPSEILPVELCEGRVLAAASVGCPPAVPIVVCGEQIDAHAIRCFEYYGIRELCVISE
ncbi:MAG: DegT/DnrJ/EryC1/StrS family aminotransferase [Clostridia bacterium]|nr:DegT/DnrJ/EryC1/StrS family aminotransferase [Clostridia bacterium]